MAGPSVAFLLRSPLNQLSKQMIVEYMDGISQHVETSNSTISNYVDISVEGCPFVYWLGPENVDILSDYIGLEDRLGWMPQDMVGLAAMCNDDIDHRWLGRLALAILARVDGVVAFGSALNKYTSDSRFLGSLKLQDYQGESILYPDEFDSWFQHPDFRMVK